MSDVHFLPASAGDGPYSFGRKVAALYERLSLQPKLPSGAMVAVKVHVGEKGRPVPVPPAWIRPVVEDLGSRGAVPFLTDTCTLYRGGRSNAVAHMRTADERGFNATVAGAPFIVADGLLGESSVEIPIAGRHFQSVEIAGVAARATGLVVVSHFTGHLGTSFGAAIKNLGMGLAARAGKLRQHAAAKPEVDTATCSGCGVCLEVCPVGAIGLEDQRAAIDQAVCTGCGQCITVCYMEGIQADYGAQTRLLQERMAEYALGAVQGKQERCAYLTFVMNVTRNCDCIGQVEKPLFGDLGLLAGTDPVAIDQAACDLVTERTGKPIEIWCERPLDPTWQLAHGEAIGLGTRRYRLRTWDEPSGGDG